MQPPTEFNQQAADITAERAKCTFEPSAFTALFFGGPEKLKRIKELEAIVDSEPIFDREDRYFLGRTERFKRALPMTKRYVELRNQYGFTPEECYHLKLYVDDYIPVQLHESMFLPVLRSQASDEQFAEWGPKAENYHFIGCYAQTELGHGSNLSRLETTATLDLARDEWIINSPTQSSAKFWIGSLGKTANHAVVQAKLIINGKDYGAHPFLVQIRSLEDHTPLEGVVIKDMGPKQGAVSMDNGYARFHNVRIPRTNMLMRFSQVNRAGEYIKPLHAKLAYGGMTAVRTSLINQSAICMARGACIATRYCSVRRQGTVNKVTDLETQVLDYPSVQVRILPLIANAYATVFSGHWINDLYTEFNANVSKGDVSLLKDVHVYSSGLKSYCTKLGSDGIEEARRTLGGHGYSMFSGMIDFQRQFVATVTYEGENGLLTQQVSRYLLNLYKQLIGKNGGQVQLSAPSRYLTTLLHPKLFANQCCQARSIADFYKPEIVVAAFQHRAARLVLEMAATEKTSTEWADLNIECMRVSKAHVQLLMVDNFFNGLTSYYGQPTKERPVVDQTLLSALMSLYHLHVFWTMDLEMGEFTEDGYLSYEQATWVRQGLKAALKAVRPNAVGFADSFGFSDKFLNSALGSYDGRAYERLAAATENEPLNKDLTDKDGVIWGYKEYLRPLIKGEAGPYTGETLYSKL